MEQSERKCCNDEKTIKKKKKYPYADMSKFDFESDFDKNGNYINSYIYFKNNDVLSTDTFNNK